MSHGPIKQYTPKTEPSFKAVDVFLNSSSFDLQIIRFSLNVRLRWSLNQIAITCICSSQDDDDGRSGNDMCINIFHVILSAYTYWSITCLGPFSSFGLWQMIKKWEMMGISLVHFTAHFLGRNAKLHHHAALSHSQMRKNEFPDSYIINYSA